MELIPGIRNAVRAVIIRDDHLLLLRKEYEDGSERFVLPGGSQDDGETIAATLQRECLEEIGTEVSIEGLMYLADYFKPRGTMPQTHRQQVEYFFRCDVPSSYVAGNGSRPDKHQVDVVWLRLSELKKVNLFPSELSRLLMQGDLTCYSVYLGEINA